MEAKEEIIKKLTRILRREHVNYEETKYIFKAVRDKLELKPITSQFQLPKFLSYEEVQKLIETAYKTKYVYGLLIKTLFITGIRVSEISNLKLEDLFLSENKIKVVQEKGKDANINKKVTPHILRHSMATYLLNKGLRLDQVQLLLGHTNPRTTEIYAKTSLEGVKEDFEKIMGS